MKFLLSFLSTRTKKDSGQSNDRSGARDNRKTPRGKKNGGLAWWSRRQREARILPAFKDQYATLVSVLGPTWHGPQNLFVMEKKNQAAILCLTRKVDRGSWSQARKCKVGASGTKVGNARVATGCTPKPVASHRRPPAMKGQMQTLATARRLGGLDELSED